MADCGQFNCFILFFRFKEGQGKQGSKGDTWDTKGTLVSQNANLLSPNKKSKEQVRTSRIVFFCENPICQVDKQLYAIGTIEYPANSGHIL